MLAPLVLLFLAAQFPGASAYTSSEPSALTASYAVNGGGSPSAPTLNYTSLGSTISYSLTSTPTVLGRVYCPAGWPGTCGFFPSYPGANSEANVNLQMWETTGVSGTATGVLVCSPGPDTYYFGWYDDSTPTQSLIGGVFGPFYVSSGCQRIPIVGGPDLSGTVWLSYSRESADGPDEVTGLSETCHHDALLSSWNGTWPSNADNLGCAETSFMDAVWTETDNPADRGTSWTVSPNPLTGSSSSERWHASAGTSGTMAATEAVAPTFVHQYLLTMTAGPGGTVTPASGWQNAGADVSIQAFPDGGMSFGAWVGAGSGSYSGPSASSTATMNEAINETASFGVGVKVESSPSGSGLVSVDGANVTTPHAFFWTVSSVHNLTAFQESSCGAGCREVWSSWSDAGARSHNVTASAEAVYSASFYIQYSLTVSSAAGGSVSPAPGVYWKNASSTVDLAATADPTHLFSGWTGTFSVITNPLFLTMTGPVSESASFVVHGFDLVAFIALASALAGTIVLIMIFRGGWFFSLAGLLLGMYGMLALYTDGFTLTYYSGQVPITLSQSDSGILSGMFGFLTLLVVLAPMLRGAKG